MGDRDVFINCPFSPDYAGFFQALVFGVVRSGFIPRCARENDDGGEVRIDKIRRIIAESRFGVHDISKTEPDPGSGLPRFNMPLELGLFLGARAFGGARHAQKKTLILDREPHRYHAFISDIAGQDIHSHDGQITRLIEEVAAWLRDQARDPRVPGGRAIATEFADFVEDLPKLAALMRLEPDELTFKDLHAIIADWITTNTATD